MHTNLTINQCTYRDRPWLKANNKKLKLKLAETDERGGNVDPEFLDSKWGQRNSKKLALLVAP